MKCKLDNGAFLPKRAHEADAGLDLYSPVDIRVDAGGSAVIDTGVHVEIPHGYVGFIKSRSGLNIKHDITSEGVVDAQYVGSIRVKLYNHGEYDYYAKKGDRITQLVILPILTPEIELVDELDDTERGSDGFGSSGR